jgi:leucyl aminopeptidase (aminopeptidase T)
MAKASGRHLVRACKILVEQCAHVRSGEEVLVISDDLQAPELCTAISTAARSIRSHAISMVYPAIPPYGEPPRTVIHAMNNADVVIGCATTPIASGIIEEALKAGARILSMFRITTDALSRTVPIDYRALSREMKRIKRILDASDFIEISSPSGTRLSVQMAGRPTMLALGSVRKPGEIDFIPAGAIGVAPLEGTAEGKVVVDGTLLGFGRAVKPVTFEIQKGRVVKVKGVSYWKGLRELLYRDEYASWLCEIGLGVNPRARLVGGPEDERIRGSVHVGLGENRYFGGTIASASHLDGTLLRATLTVDGKELVKDGRLLI